MCASEVHIRGGWAMASVGQSVNQSMPRGCGCGHVYIHTHPPAGGRPRRPRPRCCGWGSVCVGCVSWYDKCRRSHPSLKSIDRRHTHRRSTHMDTHIHAKHTARVCHPHYKYNFKNTKSPGDEGLDVAERVGEVELALHAPPVVEHDLRCIWWWGG